MTSWSGRLTGAKAGPINRGLDKASDNFCREKRVSTGAGLASGAGAFLLWGVFPVFWKLFDGLPPLELIAHRIAWTVLFLLVVLPLRGRMGQFVQALHSPRQFGLYLLSGSLLACNWLTFVYAVLTDRILETSLGYFLTPLVNVLLGKLVLRERLRPVQWLAIALASAGVLVQVVQLGRVPWIALVLAGTFGTYGLLRKQGPLGPLTGLAVETAALAPVAVGFLVYLGVSGTDTVWEAGWEQKIPLLFAGAVTATPLLLFATAARSLPLSTVGLLQYLAPTVQFLVGVFIYGEVFTGPIAISFTLIWLGLAVYTVEGLACGFSSRGAGQPAPVTGVGGQS